MKSLSKKDPTRREFMKIASAGISAALIPSVSSARIRGETLPAEGNGSEATAKSKINLGIASYTFRKFSLDQTLEMTRQLAINRIALKSFHLPLDSSISEIKQVAGKVKSAGIMLYGAGVVYMKNKDEVDNAFKYAKTAGINIIIGVPNHELLPLVEEKVKETDILVAIHNHGPGDKVYPSPESIYEKIELLDKRIGMCIDVGHVQRYGLDPVNEIKKYSNRILDVHIKDVDGTDKDGKTVVIGRGIIDTPAIIKVLLKSQYQGTLAFEYEKDEENPLPGLAESVGYVRGLLTLL